MSSANNRLENQAIPKIVEGRVWPAVLLAVSALCEAGTGPGLQSLHATGGGCGLTLTFGSLFSGIGGLDLGLERSGLKCVFQVEIDSYCRAILTKHWPKVRRHGDIKTFPKTSAKNWKADVIVGGFPCTDISVAGKRKGFATGTRDSGRKCSECWLYYDQSLSLWRTPQGSLLQFVKRVNSLLLPQLVGYSGSYPRSATMRNTKLFRHVPLVPRISGIGCLLSPTLRATEVDSGAYQRDKGQRGKERLTLKGMVAVHTPILQATAEDRGMAHPPTLRASDHYSRSGMLPSRAATNRKTGYLSEMLPTLIKSSDYRSGLESEATQGKNSRPLRSRVQL